LTERESFTKSGTETICANIHITMKQLYATPNCIQTEKLQSLCFV